MKKPRFCMGKGSGLELQVMSLLWRQINSGGAHDGWKTCGVVKCYQGSVWNWGWRLAHWGHQFGDCRGESAPTASPNSHFEAQIQHPWVPLDTHLATPCQEHGQVTSPELRCSEPAKAGDLGKMWAAALHHQPWGALMITFTLSIWWMRDRHPVPDFHITSPCIFPS